MVIRLPSIYTALILVLCIPLYGCSDTPDQEVHNNTQASQPLMDGEYMLIAEKHLLHGYPAFDASGLVNVVVEIPTGTSAKWEVDKENGHLQWEFKNGKPRVVSYLGYPGNYGMVPGTLLPKRLGGDGDPLDVIILSPVLPRGSVVQVRPIGVLKMLDRGEQDDKIIAVVPGSQLGELNSIDELERHFVGVLEILQLWFSNYKGPGKMALTGYGNADEADKMIVMSAKAYDHASTGD